MKDTRANDLFHLGNMIDAIHAIESHLKHGFDQTVVKRAIVFEIMTIGESVTKLSSDIKAQHLDIPWQKVAAIRHKIVHEYYHIDYQQVEAIVYGQLPTLLIQLESILKEMS